MDLVKMKCISAHSVPSIFAQALSSQILVEEHFGYHYRLATVPVLLVISILFDKKSTKYTIRKMLLVISFMLVFMIGTSISTPDTFWLDEDHGVLSFVYLRAKDLVEDDQSLESFMNLVVEFCAQTTVSIHQRVSMIKIQSKKKKDDSITHYIYSSYCIFKFEYFYFIVFYIVVFVIRSDTIKDR
ncbi:uncharacterized protein BX664DRAFT_389633 [Halteromyces radiatus]|uniref:uncharacterized protein n=1 Tax=Halteromyces radiatus TaxID=101107 RepID=UPI00221FC38E|nr:uncharacterized protein BX664DRAFT_389633 [Halteromyces radiatus]KAI8076299.1 hypothetical protein BX664DRAFT_389633 [Halteromyces radiatus]